MQPLPLFESLLPLDFDNEARVASSPPNEPLAKHRVPLLGVLLCTVACPSVTTLDSFAEPCLGRKAVKQYDALVHWSLQHPFSPSESQSETRQGARVLDLVCETIQSGKGLAPAFVEWKRLVHLIRPCRPVDARGLNGLSCHAAPRSFAWGTWQKLKRRKFQSPTAFHCLLGCRPSVWRKKSGTVQNRIVRDACRKSFHYKFRMSIRFPTRGSLYCLYWWV